MPARKVVSDRQLEVLVSFMEVNRGFAVGRLASNGPLAKREAEQLWKELAMTLNAVGAGATKTKAKWRDSQRQLPPLQADVPTPPPQLAPTRRRSDTSHAADVPQWAMQIEERHLANEERIWRSLEAMAATLAAIQRSVARIEEHLLQG